MLGSGREKSSDRAVTTAGDATGSHVLANARDGYRWRTAASLPEPGFGTDPWIGNVCVTASGDRAVIVYAPRTSTNKSEPAERGGFTAIVDPGAALARQGSAGAARRSEHSAAGGMPAYSPHSLFPLKALDGGGQVPAQIMMGVAVQEPNTWQAARFAVPG
ncbi:hypothetical protein [Nonomuraea helvata]|uniref:Uncharacterized protein n=1 Tax=Nonomuraea helvata TaxID=37484 RepID=A0ABV5S526_9ACTN